MRLDCKLLLGFKSIQSSLFSSFSTNSLLPFAIPSTEMPFRACVVITSLLYIGSILVNANPSFGIQNGGFVPEGSREPRTNPAQHAEPYSVPLNRDLERRQGEDVSNLLKTSGRYEKKIESTTSPMNQINAKLSHAASLGRRGFETKIYPRVGDDTFVHEKNELSWMAHELVTATDHTLSRLKLKTPRNPVDAARQERIKRTFYKGMAKWNANPNKMIEREKAKHAEYAQKIKEAHRNRKHDDAEDLRWYKKRYGQAWGHHYALLRGIDKKTEGKTKITASLPRRPGSMDLPRRERQALERTSSKSSDGLFAEAPRDP